MRQASVYPGGVMVFMEGDEPRGVYCICFGRVKLSTSSSDGRTIIVDIAGPGDIIGIRALLSGKSHDLTAETLEPTQLCFIRKDGFLGFLSRNGDVTLRLAQKLSDDLHEAYRGVRDVALKRSSERLAELLLRFCQTHGVVTPEGIQLRINLSLDELAEMIGTSRRTLTRVLTKFQDLKIIECQRRSITVRNRTALENSLRPENLF
ncbi:MAG: Crp/Fnr family transcriptional regulator [Acidobacteria bacterium]|nr:Crp/Fnr family transcriptional regulator [Acidobacteriota bacterium]